MRCEEIMKRNPRCLGEQDTVQSAAELMRDENIGFIPVCDDKRQVLGTVTDRDVTIRVVAEGKPADTKLADVMTREVVACRPGEDIRGAIELLAKYKKSRIMVVDDKQKLIGIISLSDVAQNVEDASVARTLRNVTEREASVPH